MKRADPKTIVVYGHSDDCICVDGAIREEFYACDKPKFLHFSDGTVLRVQYGAGGAGFWRIQVMRVGSVGEQHIHHTEATDEDSDYSDRVTIDTPLSWVECWSNVDGPEREELAAKVVDLMEVVDDRKLSDADLLSIYRILMKAER